MPKTHDYTVRGWGHDYTFKPVGDSNGEEGRMSGWGHGISAGDFLILRNGPGATTRYRVETIRYSDNPKDMWFADVKFAPRNLEV